MFFPGRLLGGWASNIKKRKKLITLKNGCEVSKIDITNEPSLYITICPNSKTQSVTAERSCGKSRCQTHSAVVDDLPKPVIRQRRQ